MSTWNMPPGVTTNDIPGNGPNDDEVTCAWCGEFFADDGADFCRECRKRIEICPGCGEEYDSELDGSDRCHRCRGDVDGYDPRQDPKYVRERDAGDPIDGNDCFGNPH